PTGSMLELPADTILSAIGETVDADFFTQNGIPLHAGKPRQCRIDAQTFVAGDALHGPSTIVEAIASAAQVVEAILGDAEVFPPIEVPDKPRQRRAVLRYAQSIQSEETRCLGCQQVCENCVDVCPNRANLSIQVPGLRAAQIVHVDKLCNRCGNCAVFCPYHGAPYRDKFTVYERVEALLHSENEGFASLSADEVWVRLEGRVYREHLSQPESPAPIVALMRAICADYPACIG
ncbi:MAG: putative selenate reductase subunit YgfK, partial [Clostridia bacterium]